MVPVMTSLDLDARPQSRDMAFQFTVRDAVDGATRLLCDAQRFGFAIRSMHIHARDDGLASVWMTLAMQQQVDAGQICSRFTRHIGVVSVEGVFDEFYRGPWRLPFTRTAFDVGPVWPGEAIWGASPAVDIVERENFARANSLQPVPREDMPRWRDVGQPVVDRSLRRFRRSHQARPCRR